VNSHRPLVSVIVNNYNYGRFLGSAIDSALAQTYAPLEVVVVDDGSTDDSRDVIASYGKRVVPVLKENVGQASAFNSGFARSRGDVVIFLDSDDALLTGAAQLAVEQFHPGVSKVHWPLWRADEHLTPSGLQIPAEELPFGDLRAFTMKEGPATSLSPPTSGNAFARDFLELVSPIPEAEHRIGADGYVCGLAPAFGTIASIRTPQGLYRIHEQNNYKRMPVKERVRLGTRSYEHQWRLLEKHAQLSGAKADRSNWERNSYFHRLRSAVGDIERLVAPGDKLILLDEDRWGLEHDLGGRTVLPFLERGGEYWGIPVDDEDAIREFDQLRSTSDASHFFVGWPAFRWAEDYGGFAAYVRENFHRLLSNEQLIGFDLRTRKAG